MIPDEEAIARLAHCRARTKLSGARPFAVAADALHETRFVPTTDRPLLILDVDETLLYATHEPLGRDADWVVGPYFVFRRPYLTEFLVECATDYRLAIWSSSHRGYLDAIVSAMLPEGIGLDFVWSRERCVRRFDPEWQCDYFVKDLKKVKRLGFDLNHVLIVDDTPRKVERNYGNAIYVKPFHGARDDDELRNLRGYLELIKAEPNFRALEKRGWRTKSWR